MAGSNFGHFWALLKKCVWIEMDSPSKYFWNIGIIILLGLIFGLIGKNITNESYMIFLVNAFMFLQCGFNGKMIAMNLVRDRKAKFRLTLQLIGVKQSVYMAANITFAILYGMIQILLLLGSIFMFSMMFSLGSTTFKLDLGAFGEFFGNAILFLLAYLAMCAAFSGLITQYDFASEIIGKFTFISIFVPLAYVASSFLTGLSYLDADRMSRSARVSWPLIWLPNMTFLNIGCASVVQILNVNFKASGVPIEFKYDTKTIFALVMICQFIGYLIIYYIIDRLFSTDTGGQRQLLGTASKDIAEDLEGPDLDKQLLQEGNNINNNIKIRNLYKRFGDFTAVNNVNLDIDSNSITCLLGHNGAGKTTLIDIMTGFQSPTEGGVYLNGKNIHRYSDILYGKVGYASSHDPLFEELNVKDFLVLIAMLKGCPYPEQEALNVSRETNLDPHLMKKIRECSGGTKRRVSISSSLVGNPSIVFLDEPSTGVDPENRRALWESISRMRRQDRIILLTTHHLEEAEFLSKDVIILTKGQITVRGTPDAIKDQLGVGYRVLVNGLSPATKDELLGKFGPLTNHFTTSEDRLQSIGELELTLESSSPDLLVNCLTVLNNGNYDHTIMASTLEDAFIKLGESEMSPELESRKDQLIQILFNSKYSTSLVNKAIAQVLRKFFLLFRSMIQIMLIILLIAVPTGCFYLVISIYASAKNNTWMSNPDEKKERVLLDISLIGWLNVICIIYYSFSCGFFGITPVTERLGRIRYLMKMNNVSWKSYIPLLLVPDMVISFFLIVFTFGTSYVLVHDMIKDFEIKVFFYFGLNLFIWMLTFIAQSYAVSFIFSSKQAALKHLTNVLLAANIGIGFIITFLISNVKSKSFSDVLRHIFSVLFPCYELAGYCLNSIFNNSFKLEEMQESVIYASLSFALYFSLAILFDFLDTRILNSQHCPVQTVPGNDIFDPQGVEMEKAQALKSTEEFPIQISNLYKQFTSTFFALRDVNLTLRHGEVLGLIGPNGAGKSTLFNIVSNYLSPTAGEIKYQGKHLQNIPEFYDNTGLCAQDDIIWPELSVDQHLSFYAKLKGVPTEATEQWKELMGLAGFGSFSSINLSTGMKRKLCYIISMMSNPKYKFLDEPTSGLDPVSRKLMRKLITAQKNIYGGSCVFTTHTMKDAEDLCDRVAVLVNGRLTCIDTVNNLRAKTGGINVSFLRNLATADLAGEERYLGGQFAQVFPECLEGGVPVITDRTDRKIVFFARNLDNRAIIHKIMMLKDLKIRGQIVDFEISQRSLEDLFLYLARFQNQRVI